MLPLLVWTDLQSESPYGMMDMSGNVWEWQGNLYHSDSDRWVLCGGSWYFNDEGAHVAYRSGSYWFDLGTTISDSDWSLSQTLSVQFSVF